ncbi:MAG: ABC-F family ATP-binding cassette domain-containing protein [Thermoplasmatota archaeon]
MARPYVLAEGLTKSFGGRALVDHAAFQLDVGERVALVGPNGSGKSTLFEMIAGRASPDAGTLALLPHVKLSYFTQHHAPRPGATVRDVLAARAEPPAELAAELARLEARMADPALYESSESNTVLTRFGELQREIALHAASGGKEPEDVPLFEEIGFATTDFTREVASLSGGERTRLYLASTLATVDPRGLLMLDEPTNHLDVETIEWLEEWLLAYEGALLVVAHDRAFLDNVATRVLAFERGTLASYNGNYADYVLARDADEARLAQRREREASELQRQKAVIEQFKHQKRFNGQMASRLTRLAKYRSEIDRTPDPLIARSALAVKFPEQFKSSPEVIRVRGLAKQYGEKLLFHGLDLDVLKGDRVGLVGANGAGKTTLLRILVGKETKNLGTIDIPPGVKGAYYAQGSEGLDVTNTLGEEVAKARPHLSDEDTRALLGRFGFRNERDMFRKVASLSGGERARLALLKVILAPSNLLILDEPTNHLDLESRESLVHALNAYAGALLVVSHDRWFLDSTVEKVAVLSRHGVRTFVGDFTNARTQAAMDEMGEEKPTPYLVRKGFKDFESGAKVAAGTTLLLTPADLAAKRLYRTAISMGWMVEDE